MECILEQLGNCGKQSLVCRDTGHAIVDHALRIRHGKGTEVGGSHRVLPNSVIDSPNLGVMAYCVPRQFPSTNPEIAGK